MMRKMKDSWNISKVKLNRNNNSDRKAINPQPMIKKILLSIKIEVQITN
jgi:hypothetical protein